jgi:outer membrane protein TolC
VTSISFGGKAIQLYPENVFNATISVNENIYDFGKTAKNVALDEKNKEMVQLSADQTKQKLSMAVMGNYYTICFLQEAIQIKDDQLNTLNEHLQFVQKKEATGSATQYDILTTKVRMSVIENQKTDLQTVLQIQISQLNSFMGKPHDSSVLLKKEIQFQQIIPTVDSLCNIAFSNRNEMKIARQKEEISKLRLNIIKVQNNPSLNFIAAGGYKNGYLNYDFNDQGKPNFVVGAGLKVPIFDANRSKYAKIQANADIEGNQQETELVRRNITNEIVESRANAEAALKKVNQSELQFQQAMQAYEMAKVSYESGTVTNLDLLDNYTALSESKLALFKTKIDYTVNLQRLKIALGERIY